MLKLISKIVGGVRIAKKAVRDSRAFNFLRGLVQKTPPLKAIVAALVIGTAAMAMLTLIPQLVMVAFIALQLAVIFYIFTLGVNLLERSVYYNWQNAPVAVYKVLRALPKMFQVTTVVLVLTPAIVPIASLVAIISVSFFLLDGLVL